MLSDPNALTNAEIEQNLLGGLFRHSHAMAALSVKASDFAYEAHGKLFAKMQEIHGKRGEFMLSDFVQWAQGVTFREDGDGYEYLSAMASNTVAYQAATLERYAIEISELARKRELYVRLTTAIDALRGEDTAAEILGKLADSDLTKAVESPVKSAAQIYESIVSELELPLDCDKTGLECLDRAMAGGLYSGFTYGFCGAEKSGKTTLAHTISHSLARNGVKHLYVAMEMGPKQIEQRNVARDMGINSMRFLDRRDTVKKQILKAAPRQNLFYLDAPGMTLTEIVHHVSATKVRHGIKGFILDYWQLVQGQQRGDTEEKHLRVVAQTLVDFARKRGMWCILLAQMNQNGGLFGGNGIKKACDQLYMINPCVQDEGRWLTLDVVRYTPKGDIGSETSPCLFMQDDAGPYFSDTPQALI